MPGWWEAAQRIKTGVLVLVPTSKIMSSSNHWINRKVRQEASRGPIKTVRKTGSIPV